MTPFRKLALLLSLLVVLPFASGCDDPECHEIPGCTASDCRSDVNECGGLVYECVDGELVEGHCDHSPPDASVDATADAGLDAGEADSGASSD